MISTATETLAARTLIRDMPDRSRIVAHLAIHQHEGNPHPTFSATAHVYDAHGTHSGASRHRRGLETDAGGCMHGAILDAFPGLASFVAMHLADYPAGVPMHAEANAWYFTRPECAAYEMKHHGAAYVARQGSPLDRCARYLRLPGIDSLPYGLVLAVAGERGIDDYSRESFAGFVDTLRPRWEREARAARRAHRSQGHTFQCRACKKLIPHPRAECSCGYDNGGDCYREGAAHIAPSREPRTVPPLAQMMPSTREERAQHARDAALSDSLPF